MLETSSSVLKDLMCVILGSISVVAIVWLIIFLIVIK